MTAPPTKYSSPSLPAPPNSSLNSSNNRRMSLRVSAGTLHPVPQRGIDENVAASEGSRRLRQQVQAQRMQIRSKRGLFEWLNAACPERHGYATTRTCHLDH